MLQFANTEKALSRFAHNVPVNARRALMMKRKKVSIRSSWKKVGGDWKPTSSVRKSYMSNTVATGRLANSLTGKLSGNTITFEMEYYGQWVDGGRDSSKLYPPPAKIGKWIDVRKLKMRNEKGQFAKGGKKALCFLIGRKIRTFGIPPTGFFTTAFKRAMDKLPNDIYDALYDDMDIIVTKGQTE